MAGEVICFGGGEELTEVWRMFGGGDAVPGKSALDNGNGYLRVAGEAVAKTGDGETPNMMTKTICKWALLAMMVCVPGILCGQVATFTEATVPDTLVLKPGVTRITGSLTAAGQVDRFYFMNTAGGRLTVRVQYVHRNANVLLGLGEWPHLNAAVNWVSRPGSVTGGAETALTSPFYLTNRTNSIQLVTSLETITHFQEIMQLAVSAPGGMLHPAYTVELDYVPAADRFEGGAGNNTMATATRVDATVPGEMEGTVGGPSDVEWVRFDVPGDKTLRVWFNDLQLLFQTQVFPIGVESQPLVAELMNAQGIALQSATAGSGVFAEEAVPGGQTFYVRIRSQDEYAEGWRLLWVLDDALEPNDTAGAARHVGTLAAGGRLEIRGLTVMDSDYYTFRSVLPEGVAIVVAAIPDTVPGARFGETMAVMSGSKSVEAFRNYAILTTYQNGLVTVRVTGGPHGYRLLIKPQSAYDVWQRGVSQGEGGSANPQYLPAWSDHDGDGVPAGLEWALRRSPFVATPSAISQPFLSGGEWKVNVAMPQGGPVALIQVKESVDLLEWNGVAAARTNFGGSVIPAGRTAGAVITLSRPGVPRQFLRFGVDD